MVGLPAVEKFNRASRCHTSAVVKHILRGKKVNTFHFNLTTSPQSLHLE